MKFDEWWATLTDKEQREIGLHNAKFVWNGAVDACAQLSEEWLGPYKDKELHIATAIHALKAQTQLFDDWDVKWTKSST